MQSYVVDVHRRHVLGDINSTLINKNKRRDVGYVLDNQGWKLARLHLDVNDYIVSKEGDCYTVTDGYQRWEHSSASLLATCNRTPSFNTWIITIA